MSITYSGERRTYTDYLNPKIEVLVDHQEHVGMVVVMYSQTERIMSDVWEDVTYARVFNPETNKFQRVFLWMTGQPNNNPRICCEIDASPEIQDFYRASEEGARAGANLDRLMRAYDSREVEKASRRRSPCINGRKVKVVKGRKVPIGTEGTCFWIGVDGYGKTKLGIATSDRKVANKYVDVQWTASSNCVPVNPFDGF